MVRFAEIKSNHKFYSCVERLLHSDFPSNERRDDANQRIYTDTKKEFHCVVATGNGIFIGFMTYWELDGFQYVEHLAIDSRYRSRGYGGRLLGWLISLSVKPIVLEVEPPIDVVCQKRISFYRRCGLILWDCEYLQPPYRPSDGWIKLCLMATVQFSSQLYSHVQMEIYRKVYGIDLCA